MGKGSNALEYLRERQKEYPELGTMVQEELLLLEIGHQLKELREGAGLSQTQLAKRVGTKQPNIARIESASYTGYSLKTLLKIGEVLGKKIRISFG